MSFELLPESAEDNQNSCLVEGPPVFLLPGILGNREEMLAYGLALNKQFRQMKSYRKIYIYDEPIAEEVENTTDKTHKMSFHAHADAVAKEIAKIQPDRQTPIHLAGYSFGTNLGDEVASNLTALGYETTHLVAIDNPSLALVKARIAADSKDYQAEMVSIVNYAAKLSIELIDNIDPPYLTLNTQLQQIFRFNKVEGRMEYLEKHFTDQQKNLGISDEAINLFKIYVGIAKRNLLNLSLAKDTQNTRLHHIHYLFTNATALKYGASPADIKSFTGGWDKRAKLATNQVTDTNAADIRQKSHMEILTASSAEAIAALTAICIQNIDKEKKVAAKMTKSKVVSALTQFAEGLDDPSAAIWFTDVIEGVKSAIDQAATNGCSPPESTIAWQFFKKLTSPSISPVIQPLVLADKSSPTRSSSPPIKSH
jgi:hypothetical protein